ncbi:hypothetical protein [Actinoplanes sp. NPDC049599]|uniref:hypothetical protein n=1 Tax=Actinoplanes sp. NPDC049599 TaxID=3363903 RepID=UPI00379F73FE
MTQAGHKGLTAVVLVLTALLTGGCTRSAVPDASAVPNGTPSAVPDASAVPSGTPSAAGTTSAAVDVRRVDWASATIRLPDGRDDKDCPVGASP